MKQLLKPFDYFFVLKPILFFPVWAVFMAGYYVQNKFIAPYRFSINNGSIHFELNEFIWIGLALTVLMGAVFALNQIMERTSEKPNESLTLIAPDFLTPKAAFIESAVFILIAMVVGFIFSLKIGVVFFVVLIFAGILYNFSPFKWKDKNALALLVNILAAFLVFASGWLINGTIEQDLVVSSIPYVTFLTALYAFNLVHTNTTTKEDTGKPDQKNVISPTILYIGLLFEIVAVVVAFIFQDELIFYPSFFSLPFFVWGAFSLRNREIERSIKYALLFLTLFLTYKWFVVFSDLTLFFVVVGIYYLAKLYYRVRFNVVYPTLAVDSGEKAS